MQRVVRVTGARMQRPRGEPTDDLQPGRLDQPRKFVGRAQFEVFGQIGQDQPALAARPEVRGEPGEKALEQAAVPAPIPRRSTFSRAQASARAS